MNTALSIALFVIGLGLVIYFAEKLVKGAVGTSLGFGISSFLVSVIFIGFDPENLALGAVASFQGVAGIALGSINRCGDGVYCSRFWNNGIDCSDGI